MCRLQGFRHELQREGHDIYRHNRGAKASVDIIIILVQLHDQYIYQIILNLDKYTKPGNFCYIKLRHVL